MSLCVLCGLTIPGDSEFCPHHTIGPADDWACGNRLMCDFFHRGWVPLAYRERTSEWWWSSLSREEWNALCIPDPE